MIRVILNGCNGKMGRFVTDTAKKFTDLKITAGIDKNIIHSEYPIYKSIEDCTEEGDVILDFSRPDALTSLLFFAEQNSLPIILCTTGYTDEQLALINSYSKRIAIFRSANMSIGINIVNSILKKISPILYDNFDIEIIEKHHNQKVDAPSGTAILLANGIKDSLPEETVFVHGREGISKRSHNEIGIHSIRGGSIVGDHEVIFAGQGETIEIKHSALSREVFAMGALRACEFIAKKAPGLYSMDDMLNIL